MACDEDGTWKEMGGIVKLCQKTLKERKKKKGISGINFIYFQ